MNISSLYQAKPNPEALTLCPGDTVKVSYKIKEASKERLQVLSGLVIGVKKGKNGGNFTIRRVISGIGVEHTFPFVSPLVEKIEVVRHGKVRRAKLYYIRRLSTKEARLKERRESLIAQETVPVAEAVTAESPETTPPAAQDNKDTA